jgi:tetratricopeptide (TPR) repeat protein
LAPWLKQPEKLWSQTFPEGRSYIERLARKHAFVCPVFGNDVAALAQQGEFALAHAEYRQGEFRNAADRFAKLLQDAPPSAPLLRGLGLSLARLERYDQAYKHLRAALDMEEPKDPLTAGYLALCGAMGKPIRGEDKARNVEWAISLLGRFSLPGNAEWARLNSAVFAEARKLELPIAVDDQARLCEALRGVDAADPDAAAAYAQLAAAAPDALRPEYAWLYCRAAQLHGFQSAQDLDLFGRTFRDEESARAFYAARQWDLAETAYTYLERCAAQRPGHFPEEFGPDYPERGEKMLLARAEQLEAAGKTDAALSAVDILIKLAPRGTRAHDRLAQLHYRRGDLDRAAELLAAWQRLAPDNVQPAVKRAIVEQQRGNSVERDDAIRRALELASGAKRAAIALLGAKLLLASVRAASVSDSPDTTIAGASGSDTLTTTEQLLLVCLHEQPNHVEALSCLAMLRCVAGDARGLAELAPRMDRPDVPEPRFHYLAAVCQLAAEDNAKAIAAARRAAASADAAFATECEYLLGWAHLHRGDQEAATAAFEQVAQTPGSPSAARARAVAARLRFQGDDYDRAVAWWKAIEPRQRADWRLDEPLRQTVLLSALMAHDAGEHADAADRLREAGRLGLRDGRLAAMLTASLVQAGQRLLYQAEGPAIYPVLEA